MSQLLIKNACLIDGNGGAPLSDSSMLIENDAIQAVGKSNDFHSLNPDAEIIDAKGKWIMPGMINAHVHIIMDPSNPNGNVIKENPKRRTVRAVVNLQKYLRSGVTFIRDADGPDFVNVEVEKCLKEGIIDGPGMITCAKAITITGGHGKQWAEICDGVEEVRKGVRKLVSMGADVIKVIASNRQDDEFMLTREEIAAAVQEAHRARLKTMAHATSLAGIKNAVYAGIESIEHASVLDDEVVEEMVRRGTSMVPTFTATYYSLAHLKRIGAETGEIAKRDAMLEQEYESFQKALKAGVRIALGTDGGTRGNMHENSYEEIKMMKDAGMTAMQALVASTKSSAQVLGIDKDYGTLEAGKHADFLILSENPLKNLDALACPEAIYKNGKKYSSLPRISR